MYRFDLKYLSPRQKEAWRLRYKFGWRLKRISLRLGISESGVSKMLQRARGYAGLPKPRERIRIIRTKPRRIYFLQLSTVKEQY